MKITDQDVADYLEISLEDLEFIKDNIVDNEEYEEYEEDKEPTVEDFQLVKLSKFNIFELIFMLPADTKKSDYLNYISGIWQEKHVDIMDDIETALEEALIGDDTLRSIKTWDDVHDPGWTEYAVPYCDEENSCYTFSMLDFLGECK